MATNKRDSWFGKITKEVVAMVVGAVFGSSAVIGFMGAVFDHIKVIADSEGWWVYAGFSILAASFPLMLVLLVELYFQRRRENERRVIRALRAARVQGTHLRDALAPLNQIPLETIQQIRDWTASTVEQIEVFAPRRADGFETLGPIPLVTVGDPARPAEVILEEACLTERLTRLGAIIRGDSP